MQKIKNVESIEAVHTQKISLGKNINKEINKNTIKYIGNKGK